MPKIVQIRQGDVYLRKIDKPSADTLLNAKPVESKVAGRTILAYGEVTGHHHSLPDTDTRLLTWGNLVALEVKESTILEHQEHGPLEVAQGWYEVTIQREYEPDSAIFPDRVRRVVD